MRFFLLALLFFESFHLSADEGRPYQFDVAICAIFQNEAPYLKEWIEFHKLVGVQHFYLYNNLSKDHYLEVLRPYIEVGEVDLIDWPYENDPSGHYWERVQWRAYDEGLKAAQKDGVRWLAFIDIDEYLFPLKCIHLLDELKRFEKKGIGGVCVNWQNYGSSYLPALPDDKLMIESLTYKARETYPDNLQVKSIVRPAWTSSCHNAHVMNYKKGWKSVDENMKPMRPKNSRSQQVSVKRLRVNHYWSKAEDFFYSRKVKWRQRLKVRNPETIENLEERLYHYNRVVEEDSPLKKYFQDLRRKIGLDSGI